MGESYNEIVKRTEDTDFSNNSGGICSRIGMQEEGAQGRTHPKKTDNSKLWV